MLWNRFETLAEKGRRQKACSYVLAYLSGASQLDEGNLIAKPVRFYDRFLPDSVTAHTHVKPTW